MTKHYEEDVQPQENEQDFQEEAQEEGEVTQGGEGDETNYKSLFEETQAKLQEMEQKYEQTRRDKNGLLKKVEKKQQPQQQSNFSEERLDKLELRQLDSNLTPDQIQDILTIKQAKGLEEVTDAYNHPMIQSYIKSQRESQDKEAKITKATPKSQGGTSVSPGEKRTVKQSKDWLKELPGDATDEVASALRERFFTNQ